MDDLTERAWWVFQLPCPGIVSSTVAVPAETEQQARTRLAATSYPKAPVDSWPCLGSRWTSRARLWR